MTTEWPADKIASLLASAFTSSASDAPTIDVLITFDRHGVSSHPNHISLYHGATTFVASAPSVDLYALESVNVLRKYISFFDLFLSPFFLSFFPSSAVEVDKEGKGEVGQAHPRRLLFVSRFDGFVAARRAMVNAHRSQMVWFRHLYILFSRYMVVNDLRLERVPPVQR
ncbi:hypothetical protein XA68_17902 [Ophiocordyceps unilateralis]|uniref:N-acetylglucosaminylphosphatidylinositol deacetylase n=1 Tax=Ophiocordyceps unilateralis TaxID=268505 RepID=A0A2A9P2D4_OPHUN|nr:hypothetical protein XA68_17902 [Ophiocordyceps unilateralis]